jgi:hypothetical protein
MENTALRLCLRAAELMPLPPLLELERERRLVTEPLRWIAVETAGSHAARRSLGGSSALPAF